MSKRAVVKVSVGGADIMSSLAPLLISLSVSLKSGATGDSASMTLDDRYGQIAFPEPGVRIRVSLGWAGEGIRQVFDGTVDEVKSSGSRSGGRILSISAKGFDAAGKPKDGQRRHWDDATVKTILTDAGKDAGVTSISVDPELAAITISYWAMLDESFLHMGQRLAQQIGGHFRIQGDAAVMARRGATYSPVVTAAVGANLHSWDIAPVLSRSRYGKVRATWYDKAMAIWKQVEVSTGIKADAIHVIKPACADEADARRQAKAAAETSKRDSGGGTLTIEGNTSAVPDGLCRVSGARAGVDGTYRVSAVTHNFTSSGGFTTALEIDTPQGQ